MPTFNNNGININFHTEGNPALPPLLMVHGNGNCLEDWMHLGYVTHLKTKHIDVYLSYRHGQKSAHIDIWDKLMSYSHKKIYLNFPF